MKAASSEWYTTSSRHHALPLPLSPSASSAASRDHRNHRSTRLPYHYPDEYHLTPSPRFTYDASSTDSTSRRTYTNSNSQQTNSFSKSESGGERSENSDRYGYNGEGRRRRKSSSRSTQLPSFSSATTTSSSHYISGGSNRNSDKYKRRTDHPPTFSYDSVRSSRSQVPSLPPHHPLHNLSDRSRLTESEFGATGTGTEATEESEEEEEENDENIYRSFKESLMMLRAPQLHPRRPFGLKSPSLSPAISLRSVVTELEEDEEDLPPEQVDEEFGTTEDDDEEDEEEESGSRDNVPKSPVKVRVRVEKTPDRDDKVKVTVHFEDEYDDETEAETSCTTSTADTVRRREDYDNENTTELSGSGSEEEEEEEDEEESETSSEEEEEEESENDKTDSQNILTTTSTESSHLSGPSSTSHSTSITTTTSTATQSQSKDGSESGKSKSEESGSGTTPSSEKTSRSHSARSSPVSRHKMYLVGGKIRSLSARMGAFPTSSPTSHILRQGTYTLHPLHETNDSEMQHPTMSSKKLSRFSTFAIPDKTRMPSGDQLPPIQDRSHSAQTRNRQFATALSQIAQSRRNTPPEEGRDYSGLPPINSSSSSSGSSTGGFPPKPRPFVRTLTYTICSNPASMSTEEVTHDTTGTATDDDPSLSELPQTLTTRLSAFDSQLPPHLVPRRPLLSPVSVMDKPPPDLSQSLMSRYLEKNHDPPDLSHMRLISEMEHTVQSFPSEVENRHILFSQQTPFDSIYSIGNLDQQKFNDLIALSKINKEPQEQFLFPPLHWRDTQHDPAGSTLLLEEIKKEREASSASSASSQSFQKGRKVEFADKKRKENLMSQEILTYGMLMQEPIDEPPTTQSRLKKFALQKIRKQIEAERKRIQSIEHEGSGRYESAEEDDDEEEDESSSGEDETLDSDRKRALIFKKKFKEEENTHIPMPSAAAVNGDDYLSDLLTPSQGKDDPEVIINPSDGSSWGQDMKTNFEDEGHPKQEPVQISPLGTRPNTAESGYKALPPSRVSSRDVSRQQSVDVDELEREKDRLLEEWKKGGSSGPPPTGNASIAGSSSSLNPHHPSISYHINTDPSSPYYKDEEERSERDDNLIKGDIDLTKEIPGEEKKIGFIWEEFNRDEREGGGMVDYEFSTLLDEMIMDVNSYKPQHSIGMPTNSMQSLQVENQAVQQHRQPPQFDPSRKYQLLSEMISLLSHNLRLVSSETLEDHMASLISLVSSVLKKVRKNKTEDDYLTQIACLSCIRVLCDRIQEMQSSQNLKYADLSWLFRILCKYSSDQDSQIRPEASFCLARLVKVAGPSLVVRPIYFILVMESESGGGKSGTGAKTKAAAIDTLTYALLSFERDEFHNLEEIAGWVCLAMLNEERRIRQSALECLAVIAKHLGGRDKALPLFHTLFLKEEMDHFSRSPSPESVKTHKTGKSGKSNKSDPIPFSVGGTVRLLTGPGFPIAQPIDAITSRLDKDVYPVPSTKGLIEYAVNVPTGKDLVLLMTTMLDKDDDEWDFSSSTDSLDSGRSNMSKRSSVSSIGFSDIDWSGDGANKEKKGDDDVLISPDVAYILMGKGKVNKQEVVLLDTYKKEIIPEILEMLNRKKEGKGKNKKNFGKFNKKRRRRRRKGGRGGDDERGGFMIPTLSFDCDDGDAEERTFEENSGETQEHDQDQPEDEEAPFEGGPKVVIDPPGDEEPTGSISIPTEEDKT